MLANCSATASAVISLRRIASTAASRTIMLTARNTTPGPPPLDAQLSRYRDLYCTVPELHRQPTEVDLGSWVRCRDGTIVLVVGKHAGRPLTGVIERQPDCIRWLLSLVLLEDTRHIIVTAMNGQADD
jgi:hypothetical protein